MENTFYILARTIWSTEEDGIVPADFVYIKTQPFLDAEINELILEYIDKCWRPYMNVQKIELYPYKNAFYVAKDEDEHIDIDDPDVDLFADFYYLFHVFKHTQLRGLPQRQKEYEETFTTTASGSRYEVGYTNNYDTLCQMKHE